MDFIVLLVVILSDPTSTLVVTMSFMIISNLSGSELVGLWFLLHMVTPYGPSVTVGVFGIAHNAILFEKPIFAATLLVIIILLMPLPFVAYWSYSIWLMSFINRSSSWTILPLFVGLLVYLT